MPEEFIVAEDLNLVWSNFDSFFTLPADCPFHVERAGKTLNRLIRAVSTDSRLNTSFPVIEDAVSQQN
jgi:hypothetical protein